MITCFDIGGSTIKSAHARQGGEIEILDRVATPLDDFDATWLGDGETIVFSRSVDANTGTVHLYWSRPVDGEYGGGVRFGPEINVPDGWTFAPLSQR